ncbi:MAG: UPF0280 family protein, partial [Syntrophales bacterium]|nr:UPF0280 family protein [Syntrophales bacterium]
GKADAVCIIARSAALADAAASAVGNVVKSEKAIKDGLHLAEQISGVSGALIVIGDKLGLWGDITLV